MMRGRLVGIDYGTKRVGIAIADPFRMFSQPVGTYSQDEALLILDRINAENWISSIVIGWPLEEDGKAGPATVRVQQYVNRLKKRFKKAEIILQDERYTTQSAKEMIKAGARPSLKKTGRARIDTAAAGIILQEYLEDTDSTLPS
jgi:putative holliday junction resolvase